MKYLLVRNAQIDDDFQLQRGDIIYEAYDYESCARRVPIPMSISKCAKRMFYKELPFLSIDYLNEIIANKNECGSQSHFRLHDLRFFDYCPWANIFNDLDFYTLPPLPDTLIDDAIREVFYWAEIFSDSKNRISAMFLYNILWGTLTAALVSWIKDLTISDIKQSEKEKLFDFLNAHGEISFISSYTAPDLVSSVVSRLRGIRFDTEPKRGLIMSGPEEDQEYFGESYTIYIAIDDPEQLIAEWRSDVSLIQPIDRENWVYGISLCEFDKMIGCTKYPLTPETREHLWMSLLDIADLNDEQQEWLWEDLNK